MPKRAGRKKREHEVLFGLIEQYLKTGKPVGSAFLQGESFQEMSSATIRNYFAALEKEGFVKQFHSSGGRVPLGKAFAFYGETCLNEVMQEPVAKTGFTPSQSVEVEHIVGLLQEVASYVSEKAHASVVLSAPRFDHDSIVDLHFHYLDVRRILAVIVSEFGLVHTEVLISLEPLTHELVRVIDRFAKARIYKTKGEMELFQPEEVSLARKLYQEAVASFFVRYSSFSEEDLWKVGFSHLLEYPEFDKSENLAPTLAFFENSSLLRRLCREVVRQGSIRFWIGEGLRPYMNVQEPPCSFLVAPYYAANHPVGALGILGPKSMFYKDVFRLLRSVSEELSELVSRMVVKHRISYRMPDSTPLVGKKEVQELRLLESKG